MNPLYIRKKNLSSVLLFKMPSLEVGSKDDILMWLES